jgi:hypothetical protein
MRNRTVTTVKKSQATIAWAWLRTKVNQRWVGSLRSGPLSRPRYFRTVLGATRIPSFSFNSLAIRSSPQVMFSAAMVRISCLRSLGSGGLPTRRDFRRRNKRKPFRCQRMRVSGLTTTRAFRQSNHRLKVAMTHRVASFARWGLNWRSRNKASCFRRNRFSAVNARCDRKRRKGNSPKSRRTRKSIRRQCQTHNGAFFRSDMKDQDRTPEWFENQPVPPFG